MTNSVDRLHADSGADDAHAAAPRANRRGKRERLIAAACQMVYQQGIEKTTLADIATAAGVPLGNVYYYFKTKSDLVAAIVESHIAEARAMLAAIDAAHPAPRDRLKAVFTAFSEQSETIVRYGCPQGSLCVELDKRADGAGPAAELMRVPVEWAQRQFEAMGRPDADDLAVQMIARYQGTALLASTFRDPRLMARQTAQVTEWIDDLDLRAHLSLLQSHDRHRGLADRVAGQRPGPARRILGDTVHRRGPRNPTLDVPTPSGHNHRNKPLTVF